MAGKPVVITGLSDLMFTKGIWTLEKLKTSIGSKTVVPRKRVEHSRDWANLEDSQAIKVVDFITQIQSTESKEYLFDWNLPDNAPDLCSELNIPVYFADDYLQHLPEGSLYRDAWPSLFIGPEGSRSGLHVDTFGSNFWMALMEGTKHWRMYDKDDCHLLGPTYTSSLDPHFAAEMFLAGDKEVGDHCAMQARGWDFHLEAGEVLFVPAGCPHAVDNVTLTVAISANFVDSSNIQRSLEELGVSSSEDVRSLAVRNGLQRVVEMKAEKNITCLQSLGSKKVIPWKEFKVSNNLETSDEDRSKKQRL
mmetsp:Transcript_11218/g.17627  ORF Transcript_11218/g.17627 Transcript_11218/m.17627 type:complete len:306 (+) Transcript_11218:856-1773(+)